MDTNLQSALADPVWDRSESHLAAMTARAHNGGPWRRTLNQLTINDQNNYVKNFLGEPGYVSRGNWRSLRCVEDFGATVTTVAPGTAGVGICQDPSGCQPSSQTAPVFQLAIS
jgi:hypothetical protein